MTKYADASPSELLKGDYSPLTTEACTQLYPYRPIQNRCLVCWRTDSAYDLLASLRCSIIDLTNWTTHEPSSQPDSVDLSPCRDSHLGDAQAPELHRGDLPDRDRLDRPVWRWIHANLTRVTAAGFAGRLLRLGREPANGGQVVLRNTSLLMVLLCKERQTLRFVTPACAKSCQNAKDKLRIICSSSFK